MVRSRPRQLLYVMDYEPRGTRTFDHCMLAIVRRLNEAGWTVKLACGCEPPPAMQQTLKEAGNTFVVTSYPFGWKAMYRLIRDLGPYRPELTLTSFLSPFCLPLLAIKLLGYTRRLVVIDHSSGETAVRRGWRRTLAVWRGQLAGSIVDAIVPVSRSIARRDIERVFLPSEKVVVVPEAVRVADFQVSQRHAGPVTRIAYAGQLIEEKGVHTLLRAVGELQKRSRQAVEVLIAGAGPQEEALRQLASSLQLTNVQFLGHVDSVPELFGSADIVVVPSQWAEAFGLTIAEAMACGVPCIVSDAGACSEVVGDARLVFPTGDHRALTAILLKLIDDPSLRAELGAAGRARVESHFNLDLRVERLASICQAIFEGRPPSPTDNVLQPDANGSLV